MSAPLKRGESQYDLSSFLSCLVDSREAVGRKSNEGTGSDHADGEPQGGGTPPGAATFSALLCCSIPFLVGVPLSFHELKADTRYLLSVLQANVVLSS